MREQLHLLAEPVPVELLDRRNDPRVERAAPVVQERAVGDLVRQGVLEGVLHIRKSRVS